MVSKKKLKRQLQEEKRQRKYAERDATMWCDVVLEQEDAMDTKDWLIADLTNETEQLQKVVREKQHELEERYASGIEWNKELARLRQELEAERAPKVTITDSSGKMVELPYCPNGALGNSSPWINRDELSKTWHCDRCNTITPIQDRDYPTGMCGECVKDSSRWLCRKCGQNLGLKANLAEREVWPCVDYCDKCVNEIKRKGAEK